MKMMSKSKWKNKIQMNKGKDFQVVVLKKPKFGKLFFKYLAVSVSVLFFFNLVATLFAVSHYRDYKKTEFFIEQEAMYDALEYGYNQTMQFPESEEDKEKLWKSYIRKELNLLCAYDDHAVAIYDANTREALVETKAITNITLVKDFQSDHTSFYVYECPNEIMMDVMTEYEAYAKDEKENEWINLAIKELYVKGEQAIPGKIELIHSSPEKGEIILKTYDKTPADTTGYKRIVIEGDIDTPFYVPVMWKEGERDKINAYMQEFAKEEVIWEYRCGSQEEDFWWGGRYASHETLELGEDLTVKIIMAIDINLFADYGWCLMLGYGMSLLVAVILSLVLAYRNYMVRLNHYQLDTYRREMTNVMAHDLKTPLMAISGYAQNLRENVHSEKKDYYADNILEHIQYMDEMIGNILELAKVENLEVVQKKEAVDLKVVTADILKKYEILILDKKLKVTVQGESVIQADSTLFKQAIENLVGNAIKYAKKDTTIYIQMEKTYWEVRNTMESKPEVLAEELWKPFVKGDNSRNHKGTGIGLAIVKNIVKVHRFNLALQYEEEEFVATITF